MSTKFQNFNQISKFRPNFKISTKFHYFNEISKFNQNFKISTKFKIFDQIQKFLPNLTNPLILDFNCQFLRRVPFVLCPYPVCDIVRLFRSLSETYLLLHRSHLYGFSPACYPVCDIVCLFRSLLCADEQLHCSHLCGFSPE